MQPLFSLSTRQYRWMAFLWTIGIVVACSIPTDTLSPIQPALSFDKVAHLALFSGFGVLWMRALCPPVEPLSWACLRRQALRLLLLGGLFAGGTEVYQHVTPLHRLGDPYDALANALGLGLSVGGYVLYVLYTGRASHPPQSTPS